MNDECSRSPTYRVYDAAKFSTATVYVSDVIDVSQYVVFIPAEWELDNGPVKMYTITALCGKHRENEEM